jgi:hypothetical protein
MYTIFRVQRSYKQQQSAGCYSDVHGSRIDRLVGVAVIAALALLLVLLCGLLRSLFFLLLALALSLVLVSLLFSITSALALLALLLSIRSSVGLDLSLDLSSRCDRGSSEDVESRCGLSQRCGGAVNVGPVEVLVLSVPLGRSLVVGTTEFLNLLA